MLDWASTSAAKQCELARHDVIGADVTQAAPDTWLVKGAELARELERDGWMNGWIDR